MAHSQWTAARGARGPAEAALVARVHEALEGIRQDLRAIDVEIHLAPHPARHAYQRLGPRLHDLERFERDPSEQHLAELRLLIAEVAEVRRAVHGDRVTTTPPPPSSRRISVAPPAITGPISTRPPPT